CFLVGKNSGTKRRGVHSLAFDDGLDARELLLAERIRRETLLTDIPLGAYSHDGRIDRHGYDDGRRERPDDEAPAARHGPGLGSQYVSHRYLPPGVLRRLRRRKPSQELLSPCYFSGQLSVDRSLLPKHDTSFHASWKIVGTIPADCVLL